MVFCDEAAPLFGGCRGVCAPAHKRSAPVQPADARRAERGHRLRKNGREQHERQQPRVHEQPQRQHGDPCSALRRELAAAQAHAHDAERHECDVPQAVDRADDGRSRAGRDAAAVHMQHLKRLTAGGCGRHGRVEEANHRYVDAVAERLRAAECARDEPVFERVAQVVQQHAPDDRSRPARHQCLERGAHVARVERCGGKDRQRCRAERQQADREPLFFLVVFHRQTSLQEKILIRPYIITDMQAKCNQKPGVPVGTPGLASKDELHEQHV